MFKVWSHTEELNMSSELSSNILDLLMHTVELLTFRGQFLMCLACMKKDFFLLVFGNLFHISKTN